ncbi:PAS domain-containing protein [Tropicibacter oceani]|uniref:PAS domain-containing protein n=1 Tax=Tropicibacter oceani TaxID=3058420 RepID=A0ABY8QHQ4_9RHOB|nr:PAS domain-containing protein [Tropicibacter oceani]WGW03973.1 PAS domain-containing protein [Tropicibacter oceani]
MTELKPGIASAANASGSEAVFHLSEMFYSRTDHRGVILSANSVFQRVAGFEWDQLLGAPHKIIRHPDMPKGVFQLFWDRLKVGKPIGAYVKNRAKSGRYYWVFAIASPAEGGYVSIRLKPSSDFLDKVTALYGTLLEREKSEGLTPAKSAALLLEMLKENGFANYDAFQSTAIAKEQQARVQQLGRSLTPLQTRFLEMSRAIDQVQHETTELTEAFQSIRTVPMNMRIIASRLESAGGPISAISVNYSQMLEDMSTWVRTFVDGDNCVFSRIRNAILGSQFLGFVSGIELEMAELFQTLDYTYPQDIDREAEAERIEAHRQSYVGETARALAEVEQEAKRLGRSVLDMKRYVTGLSSTRMMCKIESASLPDSDTALSGVVDQLDAGQNEIEERLGRVVELNSIIQSNTAMLRTLL